MPAAVCAAPWPGAGSTTATRSPRWAHRHAIDRPTTPPPTTTTSGVAITSIDSLRRYDPDQVLRSAAHQPPSQPGPTGLPCKAQPSPIRTARVASPSVVTNTLAQARLYLCTDGRRRQGDLVEFLDAVLAGGVDIVQLREKGLEAREELALLEVFAAACARHGALLAV